jgi:uroporphyrinogen decarboxylase
LPYTKRLIEGLQDKAPVILFGTGTTGLLQDIAKSGTNIIGLDWRTDLAAEWKKLEFKVSIQGNLDPAILLCSRQEIFNQTSSILKSIANRPGHIFNLGHGILPQTPVDNVRYLIDTVHLLSSR